MKYSQSPCLNAQANGVAPELGADDSAGQQAVTTSFSSRRRLGRALRGPKTECQGRGGPESDPNLFARNADEASPGGVLLAVRWPSDGSGKSTCLSCCRAVQNAQRTARSIIFDAGLL